MHVERGPLGVCEGWRCVSRNAIIGKVKRMRARRGQATQQGQTTAKSAAVAIDFDPALVQEMLAKIDGYHADLASERGSSMARCRNIRDVDQQRLQGSQSAELIGNPTIGRRPARGQAPRTAAAAADRARSGCRGRPCGPRRKQSSSCRRRSGR
jgi:hypothetical protein